MASDARTVLLGAQTTLRNADGSSPYNFNLSATSPDQVQIGGGSIVRPPRTGSPHVFLFVESVISKGEGGERGPIPQGFFERRMDVTIAGFAPTESRSQGQGALEALDLLQDIMEALEATRQGSGGRLGITAGTANNPRIRDFLVSGTGLDGTALDDTWTDWGVVSASLTVWWLRKKGGQDS